MSSVTDIDIDTLIAALYPHVHQHHADGMIYPSGLRLGPLIECDSPAIYDLVDHFAEMFRFYPPCETVAVAIQIPLRRKMSLYLCPSEPVPDGFDADVKTWFTQFLDTRTSLLSFGQPDREGDYFIIETYRRCYPKMRERAILYHLWHSLATPCEPQDEEGRRLRDKFSGHFRILSYLVESFLDIMSRHPVCLDDDALRFHTVCLAIYDILIIKEFQDYIRRYLHIIILSSLLERFDLPIVISKILSLPPCLDLPFDDEHPTVVVDPASQGSRRFTAILSAEHLRDRFGSDDIHWDEVASAFVTEEMGRLSKGLHWNAPEHVLSTPAPITPHPEIALFQHLLNNADGDSDPEVDAGIYITCSTTPSFATWVYGHVVNDILQNQGRRLRFMMRVDDESWCRLSQADPWTLPERTSVEVVEKLREELLSEVEDMMLEWDKQKIWTGCVRSSPSRQLD